MYKLGVASILAILVLGSVTCTNAQTDGADVEGPSIFELASSRPALQSFVDAVVRADLVEALSDPSTTYTVFAPNNKAFANLLADDRVAPETVDELNPEFLAKVLKYHVVPVPALSTDLTEGQVLETLDRNGFFATTLTVDLPERTTPSGIVQDVNLVGVASTATVKLPNLPAGNNIVHIVDEVLLPFELPDPNAIAENSVIGVALANDLSSLVDALAAAGLGATDTSFFRDPTRVGTFFAPTNEAFAAALTELGYDSLDDIPIDTLRLLLTYHVFNGAAKGALTSDQFTDGQVFQVTNDFEDPPIERPLTIDLTSEPGSVVLKAVGNDATVIDPDIPAGNIVVHIIDSVLLPFSSDCRTSNRFCSSDNECCSGTCRRRGFFGRCAPSRH